MKPVKDIIVAPMLTEKSSDLRFDLNQYVFKVRTDANKIEIKKLSIRSFRNILL